MFVISFLGLISCISLTILVLSGVYIPEGMGFMFQLIIGMFIVFFAAVLNLRKIGATSQKRKGGAGIRERHKQTKDLMSGFWKPIPLWLKILFVFIAVYGISNFVSMIFIMGNEQAAFEHGQYFMEARGKFLRRITKQEYLTNKAYQANLFTGHIAIFYAIALIVHFPKKNGEI